MKTSISAGFVIAISGMFVSVLLAESGGKSFKNYDNDPCLTKAMSHDPEYAFEAKEKSQSEAEKYYLLYLKKKDIPSFQRAKVYCQLGVLFTTCASPKRGEKHDYQKAEKYFKKVLELEPDRIGSATVRARTMLCSLGSLSLDELVTRGLDTYEWVSSIEIDEAKIKSKVLPNRPNEEKPDSLVITSLINLLPRIDRMVARNTVNYASFLPNSEQALSEIVKRFPGKQIADVARKELNKRADKVADAFIDTLAQERPPNMEDTHSPPIQKVAVAPQAHPEPNSPAPKTEEPQKASAIAVPSDTPRSMLQRMLLPFAVALVGVLVVAVLIIAARKKSKPT